MIPRMLPNISWVCWRIRPTMIGLMLNLMRMQPERLAARRHVTTNYTLKMRSIQTPCMLILHKNFPSIAFVYLSK